MSAQRFGTQDVQDLGKPLLLIHGDHDEVLDHAASEDIFERAREPKRLVLLKDTGHGLMEAVEEVHDLLWEFVSTHAGDAFAGR
jgi:hypothetical protein